MRITGIALAAAIAVLPVTAGAQIAAQERCYGVARAGENDGIDRGEAPGSATVDFQGNAWSWVEAGACPTLPLPPQPDGTPRRGSYEPLARDLPQG